MRSKRTLIVTTCLAPLLLVGCDRRTDPQDFQVPAGVSVGPPRAAPMTGALAVPGQEPVEQLEAEAPPGEAVDTVPGAAAPAGTQPPAAETLPEPAPPATTDEEPTSGSSADVEPS